MKQLLIVKETAVKKLVVLVHGNMTSSKHWDVLMDCLTRTIKSMHLIFVGSVSHHITIELAGIKDFSDDLKGFVDALGLTDFYLVGWSTGGAVCMQFVADYPGYCEKLVLLASASTRGYPFFGTKERRYSEFRASSSTIEEVEQDTGKTLAIQGLYDTENREGLKAVWNALIYTHNKPADEKYEQYVDDMLTQKNLADVYHSLNTFNISGHHNGINTGTNQAKDITIPVLILRGDRDYVVTEQMTHEIVEDLGDNASYIQLENAGHSPLIDDLETLKEVN